MAEFETGRLTAQPIGDDDRGWQQPITDGRNPVDAALHWINTGEVVGPDMMFPLALAYLTGLTASEARALVAAAQAEDPQNWIDRLRAHWPSGQA
jgi:hypothetical protein